MQSLSGVPRRKEENARSAFMSFNNVMSPSGLELNAVIIVMLIYLVLTAAILGLFG